MPLAETVEAFAALVAEGTVGLLGVSNHWAGSAPVTSPCA